MTSTRKPAPQGTPLNAATNNATVTLPDFQPLDKLAVCNLVMKGGVTSGVVFPGTIRVLASTYRFRRIGG